MVLGTGTGREKLLGQKLLPFLAVFLVDCFGT